MAHQKDEPFCFIVFFDIAKIAFFFCKEKASDQEGRFIRFRFSNFM